jgi:hypothetical protein
VTNKNTRRCKRLAGNAHTRALPTGGNVNAEAPTSRRLTTVRLRRRDPVFAGDTFENPRDAADRCPAEYPTPRAVVKRPVPNRLSAHIPRPPRHGPSLWQSNRRNARLNIARRNQINRATG